ncbi:Rv3235 family protein [Streptomyces sp. NPDC006012]|uniref:Rv3235 family protein n=1 Tax=Streptomyces sp. NPDC006012 TaxID=3364739 RepID=UPI0036AF5D07
MNKVMTRTAQRRPGTRPPGRHDSRRPGTAPPRTPSPRAAATSAPSAHTAATSATAARTPSARATTPQAPAPAAPGTPAAATASATAVAPAPPSAAVTGPPASRTAPVPAAAPPRPTDLFADRLLAVLSGQRPVHWMLRHTAGRAYDELARLAERGPLRTRGTRPVVRDIGYYVPRRDAIEAFARIGAGDQLRAMAFRLERGPDLRWRCTAVELGGPRAPHTGH